MKIIQISDLHICERSNQSLYSQISSESLDKVLSEIRDVSDISFIIVTGDISQDGSLDSYKHALRLLESINTPIYCIPGNHDNDKNLHSIFEGSSKVSLMTDFISTDYWDFYYVKTTVPGKDSGTVGADSISNLETQLAKTDKNVAIVTHHHPFPVGTPLVDDCMIFNSDEFITTLDESSKVKLIMCGHVHGDYIITRNHYTLETSPATCFQWMKSSKTTTYINKNGYKIFHFSPNGYKSECIFL